jgi:hypothetical protein
MVDPEGLEPMTNRLRFELLFFLIKVLFRPIPLSAPNSVLFHHSNSFRTSNMVAAMTLTVHIDMSVEPWRLVNDGVMGGLSAGRMAPVEEHLRFEGVLSL